MLEVAGQRCGLPVADLREILRAVAITRLPSAPPVVEGVIDVRGDVLPVIGLRRRLRLPVKELDPSDRMVVAAARERTVALLADAVTGLVRVEPSDVREVEEIVPAAAYVAGVARLPDGLVLIHDLSAFLSQAESEALDEALAASGHTGDRG